MPSFPFAWLTVGTTVQTAETSQKITTAAASLPSSTLTIDFDIAFETGVELSKWVGESTNRYQTWYLVNSTPVQKQSPKLSGYYRITNVRWSDDQNTDTKSALEGKSYKVAINGADGTYVKIVSEALTTSISENKDVSENGAYFYVNVGSGGTLSFKTTDEANCSYNANVDGASHPGIAGNFRIQSKGESEETANGTGEDHENDAIELTILNPDA